MPVLAGVDLVITPDIQEPSVLPGFEMQSELLEKRLVLMTVADKHPVTWHLSVSLLIHRWSVWLRLVGMRPSRRETEHRNFARLLQAHRVAQSDSASSATDRWLWPLHVVCSSLCYTHQRPTGLQCRDDTTHRGRRTM